MTSFGLSRFGGGKESACFVKYTMSSKLVKLAGLLALVLVSLVTAVSPGAVRGTREETAEP